MRLASRVAKLESKHKQILRCPWCRFALHDVPPTVEQQHKANPDSVMSTTCWYCGTKYVVPLRGLNKHQRVVLSLISNSHPTKQFIEERVHAALIWSSLYRSEVKEYEKAKQGRTEPSTQEHSAAWHDQKAKRERDRVEQRALDFCQAQLERFERLAKGPKSFPLDKTIEQIEHEFPTFGYDKQIDEVLQNLGFEKYSQRASGLRSALATCNLHLQNLKKREVCEVVIWGKALLETAQEINFFEELKQQETEETIGAEPPSLLGKREPALGPA